MKKPSCRKSILSRAEFPETIVKKNPCTEQGKRGHEMALNLRSCCWGRLLGSVRPVRLRVEKGTRFRRISDVLLDSIRYLLTESEIITDPSDVPDPSIGLSDLHFVRAKQGPIDTLNAM